MADDRELDARLQALVNKRRDLRRRERSLQGREDILNKQIQYGLTDVKNLKQELDRTLPDYMSPSNVGNINKVAWFFYEQVNFDFGLNPALNTGTRQTQSFQVTQEAGFLIMAISHNSPTYDTAGLLGPWQVEMRDRQSSRQFNDNPVPLQMFGRNSCPSILPTPMLLMPNAFFDVTMSTFATAQTAVGSGKHQFSFFGYRIRVEDSAAVLSTIFGGN